MNENIRKWVDALRSGGFQQSTGALRKGDAFCCLGVACEVYRRETGLGVWDASTGQEEGVTAFEERPVTAFDEDGNLGVARNWETLPDQVATWLGLDADPGLVPEPSSGLLAKTQASTLNDEYGYSFAALADAIERTFLAERSEAPAP